MTQPNHQAEAQLTQSQLKELLHYDPNTGIFTWMTSRGRVRKGEKAGCYSRGRGFISINGRPFASARLAVLYMTGKWPEEQVDHINTDSLDDRWVNLRPCSPTENLRNRRSFGKSARKGVFPVGKRFKATIKVPGSTKTVHLGYFDTEEEAHEAFAREAKLLHGEFFRAA